MAYILTVARLLDFAHVSPGTKAVIEAACHQAEQERKLATVAHLAAAIAEWEAERAQRDVPAKREK